MEQSERGKKQKQNTNHQKCRHNYIILALLVFLKIDGRINWRGHSFISLTSELNNYIVNVGKIHHISSSTKRNVQASAKLGLIFFLLHKRKKKNCLLIWINSLYHTIVLVALTAISLLALNQYLSTNFNFGLRSRQTGKIRKMTFFFFFFSFLLQPLKKMKFRASHFWHIMKGVHFKLPRWQ